MGNFLDNSGITHLWKKIHTAFAEIKHTHTAEEVGHQSIKTINNTSIVGTGNITVLTEHQTLKTINGQSLVGSGNINISGGTNISGIENRDEAVVFTGNRPLMSEMSTGNAIGAMPLHNLFSPFGTVPLNEWRVEPNSIIECNYEELTQTIDGVFADTGSPKIVKSRGSYGQAYYFVIAPKIAVILSAYPIFPNYDPTDDYYGYGTTGFCYAFNEDTGKWDLCIRADQSTLEAIGGDFFNTPDGVPLGKYNYASVGAILEKLMRI